MTSEPDPHQASFQARVELALATSDPADALRGLSSLKLHPRITADGNLRVLVAAAMDVACRVAHGDGRGNADLARELVYMAQFCVVVDRAGFAAFALKFCDTASFVLTGLASDAGVPDAEEAALCDRLAGLYASLGRPEQAAEIGSLPLRKRSSEIPTTCKPTQVPADGPDARRADHESRQKPEEVLELEPLEGSLLEDSDPDPNPEFILTPPSQGLESDDDSEGSQVIALDTDSAAVPKTSPRNPEPELLMPMACGFGRSRCLSRVGFRPPARHPGEDDPAVSRRAPPRSPDGVQRELWGLRPAGG